MNPSWLIEINASPSLVASGPDDLQLKCRLLDDVLNVIDLENRWGEWEGCGSKREGVWMWEEGCEQGLAGGRSVGGVWLVEGFGWGLAGGGGVGRVFYVGVVGCDQV